MFGKQKVLPAIKVMKDFEKVLLSDHIEFIVMLEVHVAQLENVMSLAKRHGKKILLHADLIQGLKNDEYSTEFLCQKIKPDGIISTRGIVLKTAKQKGILSIQRLFLLDTIAIDTSYKLADKVKPDFIEVLPGCVPHLIQKVSHETRIPIIAGGLITSDDEINNVLKAGAKAITTSRKELWKL